MGTKIPFIIEENRYYIVTNDLGDGTSCRVSTCLCMINLDLDLECILKRYSAPAPDVPQGWWIEQVEGPGRKCKKLLQVIEYSRHDNVFCVLFEKGIPLTQGEHSI